MTKPINMEELVLRVSALLRRANSLNLKKLTVGNLTFVMLTNQQKIRAIDRPLRKISAAAKQVTEGNFSVYLEPAAACSILGGIIITSE